MKLKRNPYTLLKRAENLVLSEKIKNLPIWYNVMKMNPMAPRMTRYIDPLETGQFQQYPDSTHKNQVFYSKDSSRKPQKYVRLQTPPEIIYPEDEIRSAFYKWHPFELLRPKFMLDTEESLKSRDWSTILGGNVPAQLSGESVVQHTLYLMSKKGGSLSKSEAYSKALDAFYEQRSLEEEKEVALKKLAMDAGADAETHSLESESLFRPKSSSEHFIELEQIELQKSREYSREIDDAKEARKIIQEKMSLYEKRHLSQSK